MRPTTKNIRTYLGKSEKLMIILKRYNDASSIKNLKEQTDRLKDILEGLGLDSKGGQKTRMTIIL